MVLILEQWNLRMNKCLIKVSFFYQQGLYRTSLKGMYVFKFASFVHLRLPIDSQFAAHGRFRLNSCNPDQASS